jgi:microcystin synthetase protein McyB
MSFVATEQAESLTPMQQGILFQALCAPEQGPYILQARGTLHGSVELGRFEQAWQHVLARHDTLRTSFNLEEPTATAQVLPGHARMPLELHDWRAATPTEQATQMRQLLAHECRRGFALAEAPLMQLALVRVADERYRLIWSCHRLLLDRWSLCLLIDEFVATYQALARQQPMPPTPARPEYVAWLRQQDTSAASAFWEQTLRGASAPVTLADRSVGPLPAGHDGYAVRDIPLSAAQVAALHALDQQISLDTLILAAWALILSRYSGEADVTFGLGVSLRVIPLAGIAEMIGVYDACVPMRIVVPPDVALLPWLRRCQEQQRTLRRYAAIPLDAIHARCVLPGEQPLFESVLIFEERPQRSAPPAELAIDDLQLYDYPSYPLTLIVSPGPALRMISSSQHFTEAMIARLAGQLRVVLDGMLADPQRPLAALTLLTERERQHILVAWNDSAAAYPGSGILHQRIEAQVARTPDAIAVAFDLFRDQGSGIGGREGHVRVGGLLTDP